MSEMWTRQQMLEQHLREMRERNPQGYFGCCGRSRLRGHSEGCWNAHRDSDGSGEAGQTRSAAEGLDPKGDSAGRSASEGIAQTEVPND